MGGRGRSEAEDPEGLTLNCVELHMVRCQLFRVLTLFVPGHPRSNGITTGSFLLWMNSSWGTIVEAVNRDEFNFFFFNRHIVAESAQNVALLIPQHDHALTSSQLMEYPQQRRGSPLTARLLPIAIGLIGVAIFMMSSCTTDC